jgi:hypothetical protein
LAKAYADCDYDALKEEDPGAERRFGDETDAVQRKQKIIKWFASSPTPIDPVILKAWQNHDSAVLIVEGTPINWKDRKFRFGISPSKTNGQWQVREQLMDIRRKILADPAP